MIREHEPPSVPSSALRNGLLALAACATAAPQAHAFQSLFGRDEDPMILVGSQLPDLIGKTPNRLVGFRYENGWSTIPIQIDQRHMVEYSVAYRDFDPCTGLQCMTYDDCEDLELLVYSDPCTDVGLDPNPKLDADDELVFMSDQVGLKAPAGSKPFGTGVGMELRLGDPVTLAIGYVYVFVKTGPQLYPTDDEVTYVYSRVNTAGQDPCANYADYVNNPSSVPPPGQGVDVNLEDSYVLGKSYSLTFLDRWKKDGTHFVNGSPPVQSSDILEYARMGTYPHDCTITIHEMSNRGGAFFTNKDGRVRAIRSVGGARSGRFTYRTNFFYPEREDVETVWKVHPVDKPIHDVVEFTDAADGMLYFNEHNGQASALVDASGGLDGLNMSAPSTWELLTGGIGSLVSITIFDASWSPLLIEPVYDDNPGPLGYLDYGCDAVTGGSACEAVEEDDKRYALSGFRIVPSEPKPPCSTGTPLDDDCTDPLAAIPNTDPEREACCFELDTLSWDRVNYYMEPNLSTGTADALRDRVMMPIRLGWSVSWP